MGNSLFLMPYRFWGISWFSKISDSAIDIYVTHETYSPLQSFSLCEEYPKACCPLLICLTHYLAQKGGLPYNVSLELKPSSNDFLVKACVLICYYLKPGELNNRHVALIIYCHLMSHGYETKRITKGKLRFNTYSKE